MNFNYLNLDRAPYTGYHGWLDTITKTVIFSSRMHHFDMLQNGELERIPENMVFELPEDGGPSSHGWMEIRQWAARKGWVHFVTDEDSDRMEFVCANKEQEKICRAFAKESDFKVVVFKATAGYDEEER